MTLKIKGKADAKKRNPLALNPLLRKGGTFASDQPRASHRRERQRAKQQLKRGVYGERQREF